MPPVVLSRAPIVRRALSVAALLTGVLVARADLAVAEAPGARFTALRRAVVEDSLLLARSNSASRSESLAVALARDIPIARRSADRWALGRLLLMRGVAGALSGDGPAALPALNEALALAESGRDTSLTLAALRWRAYTAGMLGHFDEQSALASRLIAIAKAAGDRRYQAIGHNFVGWNAYQKADLLRAREHLELAMALHRRMRNESDEAIVATPLGATLEGLGEYDSAREVYLRQLELARRLGLTRTEALALRNLGWLEMTVGDPARAATFLREACDEQRALGATLDLVDALIGLSWAESRAGRVENGVALASEALGVSERRGYQFARSRCLLTIANFEEHRGHYDAAEAAWRRILALGDSAEAGNRAKAMLGVARMRQREGHAEESRTLIERANRELAPRLGVEGQAQLGLALSSDLVDAGRFTEAGRIARRVVAEAEPRRLWLFVCNGWFIVARAERGLARRDSARMAYERAFDAWERVRARSADPQWRETTPSLELGASYIGFLLAAPDAPESTRVAGAFAVAQRVKSRTLEERMRGPRAFSAAGPLVREPSRAGVAELRRYALREDECLLEWLLGNEKSYLFVITHARARVVALPGEDSLAAAISLACDVLGGPPSQPRRRPDADPVAAALARVVFGDALVGLDRWCHLVLAPDGVVHRVPFAALGTPAGPSIARHTVTVVPSATVFARLRAAADRPVGRGLFAFAGAPSSDVRLAGARREVRWLDDRFRDVVTTSDASRISTAALAPYAALHFAGHSRLDDGYPWRSGIVLGEAASHATHASAAGNIARDLVMLRAETIATSSLAARLVVLSSCETATGRVRSGEGVAGMTSAFIAAGVPTVVSTLWPVDDHATEMLMREFYTRLGRGDPAGEALRQSQRRIARDPATADPFYWAGFVLIGDGATRLPLAPRRPSRWRLAVGVVAALVMAALITRIAANAAGARWRSPKPS